MSVSAVNSNSNVAANTPQNSYAVQHGDTLSAIARQNGVSLASLLAANRVPDLATGVRQAAEAIDSGAALDKLERLIAWSKQ